MERSVLVFLVPAYNEESTIEELVTNLKELGDVVVVDDCSSDSTARLALKAGALVIQNQKNLGYDQTINVGFKQVLLGEHKFCITVDADGQHPIDVLPEFIKKLESGYDLVIGKRSSYARLAEVLFAKYMQYKAGIRDPLCGLKGYNLSSFSDKGCFDTYRSIGTELLFYAISKGLSIVEQPFEVRDRLEGKPRFGSKLSANYKIMRALFFGVKKYGI